MLSGLKALFASVMDLIRIGQDAVNAAMRYCLHRLYLLILPVIVALKAAYDFMRAAVNRIVDAMQTIGQTEWITVDGAPATLGDILAFVNAVVPLEELFVMVMLIISLWLACMTIRTVKGVKQTVAF